ncbi:hypothetical protein HOLDEFILI_00167 [Holdemania filiformis DSM 12042]|uniref:Uncharacterized protein n=1 Tax=Holdemania filiformis DSM 12042 TaxID=545696 RepID=B9Y2Z2_9FIRM|nr:hypothetical protein HOLDEFILI_00167 [Holdemania filiformis DSM 12042]
MGWILKIFYRLVNLHNAFYNEHDCFLTNRNVFGFYPKSAL